jgi:hypothetical protein
MARARILTPALDQDVIRAPIVIEEKTSKRIWFRIGHDYIVNLRVKWNKYLFNS